MMRPLLFLLLLSLPATAAQKTGPVIRVAISRGSESLNIKTSSRLYMQEVASGQKYMLLENSSYEVAPDGHSILVADQRLRSPIKILPGEGKEHVRLGSRLYKGDLLIRVSEEGLLDVIEHLPLEEYLYGVLPLEMSPGWPLEALKAQAVASRTYALKHINPLKDYDVTNNTDRQVYGGTSKTDPRIKKAVDSTKDLVMKYKGKLITAYFHACCGGHTASSKAAWGETLNKPLYGVRDPFCKTSRHYRWRLFIPHESLLRMVQAKGSSALRIKSIRISRRDKSNRALAIKLRTDQGAVTVKAADMRKRFGTSKFKSTLITSITRTKGGYTFSGRGWGHGVGMCQDGAKNMALKGRHYRRILRHYYPGTALVEYD